MTITYIILSITLIVLIFCTIATYKLASDTKRLTYITSQQIRLHWIANMFVSFSLRIDAFNHDLGNTMLIYARDYQVHIDDMKRYYRIFIALLTEAEGKSYLQEKQIGFDEAFSNNPLINEELRNRMQSFLFNFKEEMQI